MDIFKEITARVKPEDIISFYGYHMVRGKCVCPFHNDTSPSMKAGGMNKPTLIKCFACGWAGDVIDYVKQMENCKPIEAATKINDDFNLGLPIGIELTKEQKLKSIKEQQQRDRLKAVKKAFKDTKEQVQQYIIASAKAYDMDRDDVVKQMNDLEAKRLLLIMGNSISSTDKLSQQEYDVFDVWWEMDERIKNRVVIEMIKKYKPYSNILGKYSIEELSKVAGV
jgi:hypothetical protein